MAPNSGAAWIAPPASPTHIASAPAAKKKELRGLDMSRARIRQEMKAMPNLSDFRFWCMSR